MEARSILRMVRLSPQKARLVADQVRGKKVSNALELLKFSDKKAADVIYKIVWSAMSNAEHSFGADIDALKVSQIFVDAGPVLKRMHPRAKGRGAPIRKPTAHITVVVSDQR